MNRCMTGLLVALAFSASATVMAQEPEVIPLWPSTPPGPSVVLEEERDMTGDNDGLVAGRRVMRIGNVTTPTLTVFQPPEERRTDLAVVICPGGGHRILAWDLEGTEVADWLNSLGITAIVLKYRVPARNSEVKYESAVQDAQRAMRMVRQRAKGWGIAPHKIGILGFSAGGQTAVMTCVLHDRPIDQPENELASISPRPDFAILIYPAWLVTEKGERLLDEVVIDERTPPMFFAHAFDDPVRVENSLLTAAALKQAGVPAEVHVWATGGHGFGLRVTEEPCTRWPEACEAWLRRSGRLDAK